MKKIIIFLFSFLCVLPASAQVGDISNITSFNFEDMVKKSIEDPIYNENLLVQLAFSLPSEYHQYIMPMIGNMRSISEKTRMMPGIVEWRRKLPTRIAPELEDYAKEHLRYLNPALYPFLMPEAWPSYYKHAEEEHDKAFVPPVFDINSPEQMEKVFPSKIKPDSTLAMLLNPQKTDVLKEEGYSALTSRDIKSVMTITEKFKVLGEGKEGRKRRNALMLDFKNQDLVFEALVNPCESMVKRFERIDTDGWLDLQLRKENMTKDEYIQKCDRVVKAYRMKLTSPSVAQGILKKTEEAFKMPEDSIHRKIYLTILHMYKTNREDVKSLDGFEDALKKTFKEKMMIMSTPVLLDF